MDGIIQMVTYTKITKDLVVGIVAIYLFWLLAIKTENFWSNLFRWAMKKIYVNSGGVLQASDLNKEERKKEMEEMYKKSEDEIISLLSGSDRYKLNYDHTKRIGKKYKNGSRSYRSSLRRK